MLAQRRGLKLRMRVPRPANVVAVPEHGRTTGHCGVRPDSPEGLPIGPMRASTITGG